MDHDPIDEWAPEDRENVDFWFNVSIGIEGEASADNFQVHVVSESMLSRCTEKNYLIVIPYYESWDNIIDAVKVKIESCTDVSWSGMAPQIAKLFLWEYES